MAASPAAYGCNLLGRGAYHQRFMLGKVGRVVPSPPAPLPQGEGAHQRAIPCRVGRIAQAAGSSLPTAAHHHCTLLRGREVADINDLCGARLAAERPHPRPLSRRARGAHQRAIPCRVGRIAQAAGSSRPTAAHHHCTLLREVVRLAAAYRVPVCGVRRQTRRTV